MKKIYLIVWLFLFAALNQLSAQVVINEVYGGGGNGGSTYKNDFIELYNNGTSAVDLTGWSVQYASSAGTSWAVTNLSGSIPSHGYFLIQEAAGASGTTALPSPDITGSLAMAAGSGKVLLCNVTAAQTGANPTGAQVVDKAGYGTGTNGFEGTGPTPTISATVSAQRNPLGFDSDNNVTDFVTGAPTPSNSGTGFGSNVSVAAGINAAEPATNGSFLVSLSSSAPAGGVTINYTLSGTAGFGVDYTDPQNGVLVIPQGSSSGTINLNITDDNAYEADEAIDVTLTSATAPYTIVTANASIGVFSDDINPVPLTGSLYTQNFNGWAATGTATLYSLLNSGWAFIETGTAANTIYTANSGASSTGDTYSYGSNAADRAFGTLQSAALVPAIGAQFVNNTGAAITSFKITYRGEQWRLGTNNRADQLDFQYSLDATTLSNGNWADVDQLDFATLDTTTASLGAIDGNSTGHYKTITYTINGISIPAGAVLSIRWNDFGAAGADDGLAIDDFSLETNPVDNEAPSILSYNPKVSYTGNPTHLTASLAFDENMQKGTGNIVLKRKSDDAVIQTIAVTDGAVSVTGNIVSFPLAVLVSNTAYYFNIDNTAFSDLAGNSFAGISDNSSWYFATSSTLQYLHSFQACAGPNALSEGFAQYSVTGAITWGCTTLGLDTNSFAPHTPKGTAPYAVQMNGYDNSVSANVENEDWLISPAYDLTAYTYPLLSFWSRTTFNGQPLSLKISTDYTGAGDPRSATWTDLNGRFPQQASDIWSLSKNINLVGYKQSNVHIAWVYNSTSEDGAQWRLDDIGIDNSAVPPPPSLDISTTSIEFFYSTAGSTVTKSLTVLGNDLAGGAGITVTATGSFLVSKDNSGFSSTVNLTEAEANNITKTIWVRFAPGENDKNYNGTLTVSTAGTTDTLVNLKGTSIDPAKTLEVVNWNMEWFSTPEPTLGPKDKALQRQNAQIILPSIGADLYALVEVVDTAALGNIVRTAMPGYSYIICNYGSHGNPAESGASSMGVLQKEAFVYKTSVFSNIDTASVLSNGVNTAADLSNPDYNNWSSGRYPFMMTADVTLAGETKRIHFIAVHAKANTGNETDHINAYNRRQAGAISLHSYLNSTFPNDNIIILGDFNDDLDSSITAEVSPRISSYKVFTDDAASFYSPTLKELSLTGKKSTISFNDVIDHVVVSNEMQAFYMGASTAVLTDVAGLVPNYGSTMSDHYPVFTRYAFDAALLPVRLEDFTAVREGNTVKLGWKSSEEINSASYVIQRSADGSKFSDIGTVSARGFAAAYNFIDAHPLAGDNYYRLMPVDKDGKSTLSKTIKINFGRIPALRISPNPANSFMYVSLDNVSSNTSLQLIDLNGRLLKQVVIPAGASSKTISLVGIPAGLYTVKLVSAEKWVTQKLLVQ